MNNRSLFWVFLLQLLAVQLAISANICNINPTIPDSIQFAGEPVPLYDFEVRERLDRELLVNTYFHSSTFLMLKRANRWLPIIEPILEKHGIPNDFKYLAIIESGLANVVSPAGATGYWQLMKETALKLGLEISEEVDERYHVEKSTEAACYYLKDAYSQLKSWTLAAAAYNVGKAGLSRSILEQKTTNYYELLLNNETSRYVFRIIAIKLIFENPKLYGFDLTPKDLYPIIPTYKIKVDSTIENLVDFAYEHKTNYKLLKYFNPWLRKNTLTIPEGKYYILTLPDQDCNDYLCLPEKDVAPQDVAVKSIDVESSTNGNIPALEEDKQELFIIHVVQPKENIRKIAKHYKITPKMIKQANHLKTNKLVPQQRLIIPKVQK